MPGLLKNQIMATLESVPSEISFLPALRARWLRSSSLLCVGLDPDPRRFPRHLGQRSDAIKAFCCAIVDATHDLVCAFKPQIAYFAAHSAEDQLADVIDYIHLTYPDIPVILDAKRGDIGPTAENYAREVFERYQADAVTLSPYMGFDSVEPYLAYPGKGAIILCRTSNPGGGDFQSLKTEGLPLYQQVARTVAEKWNSSGQCALVVGATFPAELREVRALIGDMPLLVPGIGAQGGDIEATVLAGRTGEGGMMINSSRAILYASDQDDFAEAARRAAIETRDAINIYR
jgi:orotidine-5'-phosphate decarboxylase